MREVVRRVAEVRGEVAAVLIWIGRASRSTLSDWLRRAQAAPCRRRARSAISARLPSFELVVSSAAIAGTEFGGIALQDCPELRNRTSVAMPRLVATWHGFEYNQGLLIARQEPSR